MTTPQVNTYRNAVASTARMFEDNPRHLITKLVAENPHASKDDLFPEFQSLIAKKAELQCVIDWYFFANMYDYIAGTRNGSHNTPHDTKTEVERLKARVVEVVLLDLLLPSGKLLRDATFAECAQAGGWYAKVSAMGKPNQIVGKVLTEQQLRRVKGV